MLIASIADLHARGKDLHAFTDQLRSFTRECVDRRVHLVLIAGDIFERPEVGDKDASTGAIAQPLIDTFIELGYQQAITVIMIPGNHDTSGVGSLDALHIFEGIPNVYVIHEPGQYGNDLLFSPAIYCIPWMYTPGTTPAAEIQKLLTKYPLPTTGTSILLHHIEVIGGVQSGSSTCEGKANSWQISPAELDALPFSHIVGGHFHRRQPFYVGALRQCGFSAVGDPAGFETWDSETGLVEFVELNAAPRHHIIDVPINHPLPDPSVFNALDKYRIDLHERHPRDQEQRIETPDGRIAIKHILPPREERVHRVKNIPEDATQNPRDLIEIYAKAKDKDAAFVAEIHSVYDGVMADTTKSEKEFTSCLK